jgi:hypothetical protein
MAYRVYSQTDLSRQKFKSFSDESKSLSNYIVKANAVLIGTMLCSRRLKLETMKRTGHIFFLRNKQLLVLANARVQG